MSIRRLVLGPLLLTVAALAGCSGGKGGTFAQVSGTVTQAGVPIDGARVTFHSTVDTTRGYAAVTDSNGKYLLAMFGQDPGIPPGLYRVTVAKVGLKDPKKGDMELDPGQLEAMASANPNAVKNALPKDYEAIQSTKLSATLNEGKNENVNFDLPKQ